VSRPAAGSLDDGDLSEPNSELTRLRLPISS